MSTARRITADDILDAITRVIRRDGAVNLCVDAVAKEAGVSRTLIANRRLRLSRTRKIASDDILDAVERVVLRDGAANLSIDAVAKEAGVSKSRVVYDHKNKSALLEALIERYMAADTAQVAAAVAASADAPHPELFGRIALVEEAVHDDASHVLTVATVLSASMPGEEKLQQRMREWARDELDAIASGSRPRAALVAYLALIGLYYTEALDLHRWSDADRRRILSELRTLYAAFPDTP